MIVTIDDVIKLARLYIEQGMNYLEALERAKKELGYQINCIEKNINVECGSHK